MLSYLVNDELLLNEHKSAVNGTKNTGTLKLYLRPQYLKLIVLFLNTVIYGVF